MGLTYSHPVIFNELSWISTCIRLHAGVAEWLGGWVVSVCVSGCSCANSTRDDQGYLDTGIPVESTCVFQRDKSHGGHAPHYPSTSYT